MSYKQTFYDLINSPTFCDEVVIDHKNDHYVGASGFGIHKFYLVHQTINLSDDWDFKLTFRDHENKNILHHYFSKCEKAEVLMYPGRCNKDSDVSCYMSLSTENSRFLLSIDNNGKMPFEYAQNSFRLPLVKALCEKSYRAEFHNRPSLEMHIYRNPSSSVSGPHFKCDKNFAFYFKESGLSAQDSFFHFLKSYHLFSEQDDFLKSIDVIRDDSVDIFKYDENGMNLISYLSYPEVFNLHISEGQKIDLCKKIYNDIDHYNHMNQALEYCAKPPYGYMNDFFKSFIENRITNNSKEKFYRIIFDEVDQKIKNAKEKFKELKLKVTEALPQHKYYKERVDLKTEAAIKFCPDSVKISVSKKIKNALSDGSSETYKSQDYNILKALFQKISKLFLVDNENLNTQLPNYFRLYNMNSELDSIIDTLESHFTYTVELVENIKNQERRLDDYVAKNCLDNMEAYETYLKDHYIE